MTSKECQPKAHHQMNRFNLSCAVCAVHSPSLYKQIRVIFHIDYSTFAYGWICFQARFLFPPSPWHGNVTFFECFIDFCVISCLRESFFSHSIHFSAKRIKKNRFCKQFSVIFIRFEAKKITFNRACFVLSCSMLICQYTYIFGLYLIHVLHIQNEQKASFKHCS